MPLKQFLDVFSALQLFFTYYLGYGVYYIYTYTPYHFNKILSLKHRIPIKNGKPLNKRYSQIII